MKLGVMMLLLALQQRVEIAERIEEFYLLCIYQHSYTTKHTAFLKKKFDQSKVIELPEVEQNVSAKSFLVWAKNYEQNEALFYSIRVQARQETVIEISKALTSYYLEQYPQVEKKLQNPKVLDEVLSEVQQLILATSFLTDDRWLEFYQSFKDEVRDNVIDELVEKMTYEELNLMEDDALNYLFFDFFSSQIELNGNITNVMITATNRYMDNWLEQIICEIGGNAKLNQVFSHLNEQKSKIGEFALQFTVDNHLYVMNNLPYQIVREAIYKNQFTNSLYSPFPTATILKGNTEGRIEINPIVGENPIQYAWEQVEKISDIDVDVFDALCNYYLSKKRQVNEIVKMSVHDLLNYRGLKPKRSGDGRRGGFDAKQKLQIMQSLSTIQSIKIDLTKLLSFEKGKPKYTKLCGRTFLFKDEKGRDMAIDSSTLIKDVYFTLDESFAIYLAGTGRQVALQHMKALHYHPTQQLFEKRLCRYLSWRWRTQARKSDYLTPNTISTMMEAIGIPLNERVPSRTRERLERAFDQLQSDGVIESWQYERWDENIAEFKGWGRIWWGTGVVIEPPKSISKQYLNLEKKAPKKTVKVMSLKDVRLQKNLSLIELAEQLAMSITELSDMERGKIPLGKPVIQWLEG